MFHTARKALQRARRILRVDRPHRQNDHGSDRRSEIARQYLHGAGIEIGALHQPLTVPPSAHVRYVDRMDVENLRKQYPELAKHPLVQVDIVDDGERLGTVEDASQDFVIANHFLEHCQDPIGTIKRFFAVLKPGGILYAALPDKRYTFDKNRAVTTLQHLWEDHEKGPERSRLFHFEDYVVGVHAPTDEWEKERLMGEYLAKDYSIHFHVWTQTEMIELMLDLQRKLGFEIELVQKEGIEVIFVLRKTSEND